MLHIDLLEGLSLRLRTENGARQVFDPLRRKWLVLTPEEHVRQAWISYLVQQMQYPAALIALEKQIRVGPVLKRFDIVVYNREHEPWLLAELKAPEVPVNQQTLYQLLQYQSSMQCRYWLLSNGVSSFCADACDPAQISWLQQLPPFTS